MLIDFNLERHRCEIGVGARQWVGGWWSFVFENFAISFRFIYFPHFDIGSYRLVDLFSGGFILVTFFIVGSGVGICMCAYAYVINQNKSTLSLRVDCGLSNTFIHIHSKPMKFGGENISQNCSSRITVRNKFNQNKMRSLNIYDGFYLFMWFRIVWMCVIDVLNAVFDWNSIASQSKQEAKKREREREVCCESESQCQRWE